MLTPDYPVGLWLSRCRSELSALIPFCAPALYSNVTPSELQAWAEGIWATDRASCPEAAAHRAIAQMMELSEASGQRGTAGSARQGLNASGGHGL